MPKLCCAGDIMYMHYTIDHVRVCKLATDEKQTNKQALEINLALHPLNNVTLTVPKMTVRQTRQNHNMGTDDLNTNQITVTGPTRWTLTISLSGEITPPKPTVWAQAKSEAARKAYCGIKWTPCCRQTGEKQEKKRAEVLAEHLWTQNPTPRSATNDVCMSIFCAHVYQGIRRGLVTNFIRSIGLKRALVELC